MPSAAGKRPARWNMLTPEWICTAVASRRYWIAGWRFLRTTRLAFDANTVTLAGRRSLAGAPRQRRLAQERIERDIGVPAGQIEKLDSLVGNELLYHRRIP